MRLDFSLPEFTRIVWSSERARDVWEFRINAINTAWSEIEKATVKSQMRLGGIQNIEPENLMEFQSYCLSNDLGFSIISREGSSGSYGNASHPVKAGQPWVYRAYYGFAPKEFLGHWEKGDEDKIGKFLGYPVCCTKFFSHYWKDEGWRDLTYPMTELRGGEVNGPFSCNILLRHLGVRAVFHLPCSFSCRPTARLGEDILEHGCRLGFGQEVNWLIDMLNWPIRWSSLHGVAMITTPILKIVTSSDALESKVEIDRNGPNYPEEGVTGNEFPFDQKRIPMVDGIRDTWSDNGFSSFSAMKRGHDSILREIARIPLEGGKVMDFGCGNGLLLEQIRDEFQLSPYGVEVDPFRQRRAVERLEAQIHCENIFDHRMLHNYELALISLNRFDEVNEGELGAFLLNLSARARYLLVYSYEDRIADFDTILERYFTPISVWQDGTRTFKSR